MQRIVVALLTVVALLVSGSGGFDSLIRSADASQSPVKLCTTNSNPPMEYTDPHNPTASTPIGFDIDFARAVAKQLNRPLAAQIYDFGGLIPAMQAGRCDIILAGMFATPKREEVVDFIRYMKAGTAFLVRKGNPKHIKGFS